MVRATYLIVSISFLFLLQNYSTNSEEDDIKLSLIGFLQKLSPENPQIGKDFGWIEDSDPCDDSWKGVSCNNKTSVVRGINLQGLRLGGWIDASLLCKARSVSVVSLNDNILQGQLQSDIANCTRLTHLYIGDNRLSGTLPSSLSRLRNLKRLDISGNNFSGELPVDLPTISGLVTFLAQDNRLDGLIPPFDFTNLQKFNVSNNLFTGPVPPEGDLFGAASFSKNPGLCGKPLPTPCPYPNPTPGSGKSTHGSGKHAVLYSGYILAGLLVAVFCSYMIICRGKHKNDSRRDQKKPWFGSSSSSSAVRPISSPKPRFEYSISSPSNNVDSPTSLVVLKNPIRTRAELRFEDLLKAPAELLGRGRFGSTYKVMFDDGATNLVVKRIKDPAISRENFQKRMERIHRVKHRNVLPAVAFHCSDQEKLVVYEYQQNGSLFSLLGNQSHRSFDWMSRLSVAAGISEGLAFMHKQLYGDGIGHGNLKATNIMMDDDMRPCISEYGLIFVDDSGSSSSSAAMDRKADVYSFGVLVLELLTGKLVQNNGFDLARWVQYVVKEEWTIEVFDKDLVSEGSGQQERMVHLLRVALDCMEPSPDSRPDMDQVAAMINTIVEEEQEYVTTSNCSLWVVLLISLGTFILLS